MMDLVERGRAAHPEPDSVTNRDRVLFLCTRNSARSLMAEAILNHLTKGRFEVLSAGLRPGEVHPLTKKVLQEMGIDPSELRSKGLETIMGRIGIKYAIVVCEEAEMACPRIYPFATQVLRWPFEDPVEPDASEAEQLRRFRDVRDRIERHLRAWLSEAQITESDRLS